MKSYATFFIIALMSLGLVFLLVTKDRSAKHDAPAEVIEAPKLDGGPDGGAAAKAEAGAGVATGPADAAPPAPTEKPLRVTSLGWDLVAAGAALGGTTTPPIELAPETALDAVEARLAKGGGDPQGADIAVLPLPAFVASFERLRALEPRAFLVVAFSHGREELHANAGALMKAPPAADEVKLVALGPATPAEARSAGSESATVLGLFALDLLGVAPSRVRFLAPGSPEAKPAPFAALVKGATDDRKLAFSTADAGHLVPIVAIAPKGVIDSRESTIRDWSKAWLDGVAKVKNDVPGIARKLAAKEGLALSAGVGGAPEALVLVERLGQLESVGLDKQTTYIGALAKGPVTLDGLLTRTWQLERAGGLTANAAPEPLPSDARVVAMIAPPPKDATTPAAEGDAGAFGPLPTGTTPLVQYRATEGDADRVATQIAFLSVVFDRAVFKISAKGGDKAAKAIAGAARDKGVSPTRLAPVGGEPAGVIASVDVLSPP